VNGLAAPFHIAELLTRLSVVPGANVIPPGPTRLPRTHCVVLEMLDAVVPFARVFPVTVQLFKVDSCTEPSVAPILPVIRQFVAAACFMPDPALFAP